MNRLGYERKFALGIVASSALLGMLIPPSILMIVYGVITEEWIGKLFAAGVGPGLVVGVALSCHVLLACVSIRRLRRQKGGRRPARASRRRDRQDLADRRADALVLGGIYGGLFTPTEAGAIGALGALGAHRRPRRFT